MQHNAYWVPQYICAPSLISLDRTTTIEKVFTAHSAEWTFMFLSKATGKGKRLKDIKAYKEELEGNPKIVVGVREVIRQSQDNTLKIAQASTLHNYQAKKKNRLS